MHENSQYIFCVGGALPPEEYERFREVGITHVIDLHEEAIPDIQRLKEMDIVLHHVPVPDRGPPTNDQLLDVASRMSDRESVSMYVHCKGGFTRR